MFLKVFRTEFKMHSERRKYFKFNEDNEHFFLLRPGIKL